MLGNISVSAISNSKSVSCGFSNSTSKNARKLEINSFRYGSRIALAMVVLVTLLLAS